MPRDELALPRRSHSGTVQLSDPAASAELATWSYVRSNAPNTVTTGAGALVSFSTAVGDSYRMRFTVTFNGAVTLWDLPVCVASGGQQFKAGPGGSKNPTPSRVEGC